MKPLKELEESLRADVIRYYNLADTQNINGLLELFKDFVSKNFTLSHWIAEYQYNRDSLEAEYKDEVGKKFATYKLDGVTDKQAETQAKADCYAKLKEHLEASRRYTTAKQLHGDVERLLDALRTKISILRKELDTLNDKGGI